MPHQLKGITGAGADSLRMLMQVLSRRIYTKERLSLIIEVEEVTITSGLIHLEDAMNKIMTIHINIVTRTTQWQLR